MTVEELQIIVDASIEPAMKEIKKFMPQIKQQISQAVNTAQKAMEQIDMKNVSNKVQKAVQVIRNKIDNLRKSSKNNELAITVNNKDVQKQITQIEKQIDSLQKKISGRQMKLDVIEPQMDNIINKTRKEVTPAGVSSNSKAMDNLVNSTLSKNKEFTSLSSQAQKLYNEIEMYNKELEEAKSKMSQLKQETNQTATTQNKMSSFFNSLKGKIEQAKGSVGSLKNSFNQLPKITQKVTNNIKQMSIGIKQGLGHVLKYAGALFGIRSIYNILKNSASAWLSSQNTQAQQLSANIEYMRFAMGSVFAPVIEYVTNLVYKLMKAIQSLVYAFSGVNIFAKATASSMKSAAGSAKQASKSLSSVHSEINNVSDNNSGSGGSGSVGPDIDLTKVDTSMNNWIAKIKEKLTRLFEPIKISWDNYGQPLINSMNYAFDSNLDLIRTIGRSFEEVWLNGTGEDTVSTILQTLTSIFNIIGNIGEAFKNAWQNNDGTQIIQDLWDGFNHLLDIVKEFFGTIEEWTASSSFQIFANSIVKICGILAHWFEVITGKLKEIWEDGGKETFTKLLEFISKVTEAIGLVLEILSPVVVFLVDVVGSAIQTIIKVIGDIIDALSGILDFIIGVFTGDWDRAWEGIRKAYEGFKQAVVDLVKGLVEQMWKYISTVLDNIKNTWNTVWNGLKNITSNIFNGIWNTIKKVINSILGGVEGMANGVVNGVNTVIKALNKIKINIPDWIPRFGRKEFWF